VESVTNNAQLEVPGSLVASRVERRIHNLGHELEHREATMEEYLADTGQSREEFEAAVRQEIEAELKRELVLDEIAQRENIEVSNDEIEDHYLRLAAAVRQPVEKVVEQFDVNSVRASILQRKAVDWLLEHANVLGDDGAAQAGRLSAAADEDAAGADAATESAGAEAAPTETTAGEPA